MDTLNDKHCFAITRWSKIDFIRFSKFITSVKSSNGRTKEEIIAIYRYWLWRRIDQTSLSFIKTNCTQQDISNYLSQIRVAIRTRDFFLQHNTIQTTELFKLNKNTICMLADGTYTRLEKSFNNQFQYDSWSEQKKDLLIKPFLITCADGYIIDCYGPFKANQNDAIIFEHILNTDFNIKDLIIPDQCVIFLDRGN